jgi:hypothetical protein
MNETVKHFLLIIFIIGLISAEPYPKAIRSANEIIRVFSGQSSKRHISDDLRNIARYGHSLPDDMKRELKNLGFNFTGPIVNRSPLGERSEAEGLDETYDNGMFRFHYTTTGINAVSTSDTNSNSIPDYVEQMSDVFNYVTSVELTTLGFVEPPGDDWYPLNDDNGGSGLYDIYIRSFTANWYGYVQPESWASNTGNNEHSSGVTEVNAMTSYMAMRNNYNGFPNTLMENIQVTASHEYFHAVQFGYDGWEESWVMEATAVQLEEMVYDDINDCYQYMPSWFYSPHQSLNLDSSNRWYGSFIFFEYVNTHLNNNAIREFWEKSITHDSYDDEYSIQTLDEAFQDLGSSFADMLNGMSIANRILSSNSFADPYTYEEADAYFAVPATFSTVSFSTGTDDTVKSINLQANAAQYIRLISNDPVLATLTNDVGPNSDLELHAIMTYGDSAWTVWSGSPINVDPAGISKVYFVVVSQNNEASNFDYTITFTDGQTSNDPDIPEKFNISNAYPNPFNPQTQIQIDLLNSEYINAYIYDVNGRMVSKLINDYLSAGQHVITWDGLNNRGNPVASGTYFVRVMGENQENWQKVTLLK